MHNRIFMHLCIAIEETIVAIAKDMVMIDLDDVAGHEKVRDLSFLRGDSISGHWIILSLQYWVLALVIFSEH